MSTRKGALHMATKDGRTVSATVCHECRETEGTQFEAKKTIGEIEAAAREGLCIWCGRQTCTSRLADS